MPQRLNRALALLCLAALPLQGCVVPEPPADNPAAHAAAAAVALPPAAPRDKARVAAETFVAVAARVEPVAEDICRRRRTGPLNCNFTIAVDDNPVLPPNAYQTLGRQGRPYVVFTLSLIAMARNADELAFVMGHEAAHHIAGHIPRRQEQAMAGAILAGVIAQSSGLTPDEVRKAQDLGAADGAQHYSKAFELEADALGTEIALDAGFDPVHGAAFFDRLPDPGASFLASHPPNAERKALVARTVRRLTGA